MKEMVFEWLICILCASVLMIIHEMVKTAIYLLQKRRMHQKLLFRIACGQFIVILIRLV